MIGAYNESDYFERQEAEVEREYFKQKREMWNMSAPAKVQKVGKDPKQAVPAKPQMIIYGEPGVGKTWFSLGFPRAYLLDCEGGANLPHYTDRLSESQSVYFGPEDGATQFDKVISEVQSLVFSDHDRQTLIIDGFTKLFENEIQNELREMLKVNPSFDITKTYGAERKIAIAKTRQLMALIFQLDINVVIIAQSSPDYDNDGTKPDVHKAVAYDTNLIVECYQSGPARYARVIKSRYQQFLQGDTFGLDYKSFQKKWRGK